MEHRRHCHGTVNRRESANRGQGNGGKTAICHFLFCRAVRKIQKRKRKTEDFPGQRSCKLKNVLTYAGTWRNETGAFGCRENKVTLVGKRGSLQILNVFLLLENCFQKINKFYILLSFVRNTSFEKKKKN